MPHEIVSFDEPKLQEYLGELVRKDDVQFLSHF